MWTNIRHLPWLSKRQSSSILTCWWQKQWLSGKQSRPLRSYNRKQSPDWPWWLLRRGTGEDPPVVCLRPRPAVCHQPNKRTFYPTVYTPTRQQTAFHEAVDLHSFPFRRTNCDWPLIWPGLPSRPGPPPSSGKRKNLRLEDFTHFFHII